jgi:outer membrane protein OmpA-like peptidoglycan-associated protein
VVHSELLDAKFQADATLPAMKRFTIIAATALLGGALLLMPLPASAHTRVGVGVGIGVPGPYYYGPPAYYYPPRPYYYGPSYYYDPPPPIVYETPPAVVQQAPAAFWYYCAAARAYFPYVKECAGGWQAVPAQAAPASTRLQAAPAPAGRVTYRLGDVLFAAGKAELQAAATATLDSLLASIKQEPNRRIVVEGHTDASGRSADNLGLSQRRADAVKQYLVAHGVPADHITAVGRGEAGPIAGNATADGRQQNRRVDIIVS